MKEVIIVLSEDMYGEVIFREIIKKFPNNIAAVIYTKGVTGPLYSRIKKNFNLIKKTGLKFAIYKLIETLFHRIYISLFKKTVSKIAKENNIETLNVLDISQEYDKLNSYNAKYIFNASTQIYKKDFFDRVNLKVINAHGSLLPKYRGASQYIWYLIENLTKAGVTLHFMEPGLDKGNIILQKEFNFVNVSAYELHYLLAKNLSELFSELMYKINEEIPSIKQDENQATYVSLPTSKDMNKVKKLIRIKDFFTFY